MSAFRYTSPRATRMYVLSQLKTRLTRSTTAPRRRCGYRTASAQGVLSQDRCAPNAGPVQTCACEQLTYGPFGVIFARAVARSVEVQLRRQPGIVRASVSL